MTEVTGAGMTCAGVTGMTGAGVTSMTGAGMTGVQNEAEYSAEFEHCHIIVHKLVLNENLANRNEKTIHVYSRYIVK